jgi:four helix bundle protein
MSKVRRFEDLVAWQKARELATDIYVATRQSGFAQDRNLVNQMRRAVVSIASNIAEGYERNSQAEFRRFLAIAKGSCAELRTQLYIALDVGYVSEQECSSLISKAVEVSRIIGGLRRALSSKQ